MPFPEKSKKRKLKDDGKNVVSQKKKKRHSLAEPPLISDDSPVFVNTNQNTQPKPNKKQKQKKIKPDESTTELNEEIGKHKKQNKVLSDETAVDAPSKTKKKKKKNKNADNKVKMATDNNQELETPSDERNSRTLFVGNVEISTKKEQLLKAFCRYGKIESVRLRGVTPADPKTPKRLAAIQGTFHPKRTSLHSYIVFQNREDALKATELNGTKLNEHYIRVQLCDQNVELEPTKAIFLGNIPFDTEENDLWNTFKQYGKIVSVRLIRNSETGMCIGIGYVNFESSDAVELVLMAEGVTIKKREVRIQRYAKTKMKKKELQANVPQKFIGDQQKKPRNAVPKQNSNNVYQGSKFVQKKKKNKNKTLRQNMRMIKKIAPR